jgi:hypothetical protein
MTPYETCRATGESGPSDRRTLMRKPTVAVILAAMALIAAVTPVSAAGPVHEKTKVDETATVDLCGIEVEQRLQLNVNNLAFANGDFMDVTQVRITWTNADGDWLSNFVAGPFMVIETLDGDILTVEFFNIGIHEMLRSSEGIEPAFDRGQIVFTDVVDLNDLEDPDDDVLLSSEMTFVAGPHPEADADFELFCEVVVDVLG